MPGDLLTLFLCGDVMLGRGVDQVLPSPGDPRLREPAVQDARTYVSLAESVNGPLPRPVDPAWPWGVSLETLDAAAPDVRIINLETSVTTSDDFAPGKAVHYRMHPGNLPAVTVVGSSACVLANNHVMDFGVRGLIETLDVLHGAGVRTVGAGRDVTEAEQALAVHWGDDRRLLVFAFAARDSGVPPDWAARRDRPGVAYLAELSEASADHVLELVRRTRRAGDLVVVSLHWGGNWGYDVPRDERRFAHRLVDGGVDVVHGHSSHHPRPVEVYRGRLVLYGCGDLVDDYEGIRGHERYRPQLRLLYLAGVDAAGGRLVELRMTPLEARRLQLHRAGPSDAAWLARTLTRVGAGLGAPVVVADDGTLVVRPSGPAP